MTRLSARLQAKRQAISQAELEVDASAVESDADEQQACVTGSKQEDAYEESSDEDFDDEHDKKRVRTSRSGRKRAIRKKASKSADAKTDGQGAVVAESSKRARKLPADQRFKKVRGKLGLLDKLVTDVPVEVVFEVFSYLQPADILQLARTSKELRNMLMNKSSESIWRAARANVPSLPPLPQDLNEAQYANLMFFPHCHFCMHKGRCENVSWEYRVRCCKKCEEDVFHQPLDIIAIEDGELGPFNEIRDIIPSYWIYPHSRRRWSRVQVYRSFIVRQYMTELKTIEAKKRAEWLEERKRNHQELVAHAKLCMQWHQTGLRNRAAELDAARDTRRQEILSRLEAIGWADEARQMMKQRYTVDRFSHHKLVNSPAKLTDRGWALIQQPLVDLLQDHKNLRLERLKYDALQARYSLVKIMYTKFCEEGDRLQTVMPDLGDIFICGLFDRIIWTTPFDEEVTEDDLSRIFTEDLPPMIDKWRAAREDELVDILRKTIPTASRSDLRLATTMFECIGSTYSYCSEPLWYPRVFYHNRHYSPATYLTSDHVDLAFFNPFANFGRYPWDPKRIKYSPQASQVARKLVEACNLDPATATFDDLSASDPLIECSLCAGNRDSAYYRRRIYRWYSAFSHVDHDHFIKINDFGEFKEEILAAAAPSATSNASDVRCRHCNNLLGPYTLPAHLESKHGIDSSVMTTDHWYWDPAMSIRLRNSSFVFEEPQPTPESAPDASTEDSGET